MKGSARRDLHTVLFAAATLVVLILAYIPMVRAHQGWEDEIFWFSTCLSMMRHQQPIPSVLDDFPGTHTPLLFYGPTLFWLGTLVLKTFGATMRSWRAFTFAGDLAFLAAIAVLFRRVCGSWRAGAGAAFVFALSLTISFWFSLPGRTDAWTLALVVLAMVVASSAAAHDSGDGSTEALRWLAFGVLVGVAASTTPRCWPLLFSMVILLPLLMKGQKVRSLLIVLAGCLAAMTLIFLPLHSTPWGHVSYVHQASSNDRVNVAPLMGGSWGFGHAITQIGYYGIVFVILALIYLPGWREQDRFTRWLLPAGLLNLFAMTMLVSRALATVTFWAFPLEIVALVGLMRPARNWQAKTARLLGVLLLVYMATLRTARELPVFAHWQQRDPAAAENVIASSVPTGSLVYGPVNGFFYPTLRAGSDYRYLIERTTPGLSSTSGELDRPTPMTEACHRPAYLVWPAGEASEPLPQLPYAVTERIADHRALPPVTGQIERIVESLPAGRADADEEGFTIYRLHLDPKYCAVRHESGVEHRAR